MLKNVCLFSSTLRGESRLALRNDNDMRTIPGISQQRRSIVHRHAQSQSQDTDVMRDNLVSVRVVVSHKLPRPNYV